MTKPYNPLDKKNLAENLRTGLMSTEPQNLAAIESIEGAGVYALYYTGSFHLYAPIANKNKNGCWEQPIYVGKAAPPGARKGLVESDASTGNALRKRLQDHQSSIRAASSTLDIGDFWYRALVVDDIWIPLGESILITTYKPIWNTTVDGFGNHNPGRGRHAGMMPSWDVLHPGRSWASRLTGSKLTHDEITKRVDSALSGPSR